MPLAVRFAEILADTGVTHGLIGPREVPRLWDRHVMNCAVVQDAFPTAATLVDVGRRLDPDNNELFTWWAPWRNLRQRNIGWRIDYVLASAPLAERALTAQSRREFGTSDHAPVVVTFS